MTSENSTEYLTIDGVAIIRPSAEHSSLFENVLDSVGLTADMAKSLSKPQLIVDLSNVKFVGSAFLGRCILLQRVLQEREGGRFALSNMNSFCAAAFSVAKLDTVLSIYPTATDAIAAFKG